MAWNLLEKLVRPKAAAASGPRHWLFHAETERLLDRKFELDASALARVERQARRHGISLSRSYLEWASVKGAAALLHQYSNTDRFWFELDLKQANADG